MERSTDVFPELKRSFFTSFLRVAWISYGGSGKRQMDWIHRVHPKTFFKLHGEAFVLK